VPAGAVVAIDAAALRKAPEKLTPVIIRAPGARESIGSISATKSALFMEITQNVRGRVAKFSRAPNGAWTSSVLSLPDNASTSVGGAQSRGNYAMINVTSFLLPTSLWLADAASGTVRVMKSLPARFDASRGDVEQFEATSSDGVKIPYFVVRPKGLKLDGTNPTILEAYGGFEVSNTPNYDATTGKVWLEAGGVYVLANIRGGGEFGPAWHEAGLKTKRQIIYDDFVAVARDLIARKITSPRHLGIVGGSNGGLLMGVTMTQHPELFNAVQIAVPLLDMMRYEQIAAGTSWVGEYGSVSVPAERAFLASISPLQNLKPGAKYPTPFIWTTTKDDRVGPQHARKFAAKMSDMRSPYLFYEVIEGGHGAGANAEQSAHTSALGYVYFMRQLMDKHASVVP
jgi:prolyl oligopeptidase